MSQDIWAIEDLYLSRDWGKNQRGEAAPETSHTCSWFQGHRSLALESSGQAWWAAPTLWCQQPSWPSWPQPWPLTHQTLKKMLPCRRVGPAPILSQGEKLDFSDRFFLPFIHLTNTLLLQFWGWHGAYKAIQNRRGRHCMGGEEETELCHQWGD